MEVLAIIPSFKSLTSSRCDDWVDRLNHVHTVIILLVFAAVVSAAQYVGAPIYCWIPPELDNKDGPYFKHYIHNYCWIKNTYYIPIFDAIPTNIKERQGEEITYYQWVPVVLLLQAFMFKFPNLVWKLLQGNSGLNIDKLCKNAEFTQAMSPSDRQSAYDGLVFIFEKWIGVTQPYKDTRLSRAKATCSRLLLFCGNKRSGTYLTGLYLGTKVMFCANVIGQLFLLNDFITTDSSSMYGYNWVQSFHSVSPRFPRVTLCDFYVRQMANVQTYTVQCVLPINLFNEKVFLFLWFWFLLVAFLSFFNLIKWFFLIVWKRNNHEFVKKYLKIGGNLQRSDKVLCKKFGEKHLRDDGCLVARMISMNSSDMVVTEMFSEMFRRFRDVEEPKAYELREDENENNINATGNDVNPSGAAGNKADNYIKPRNGILRQNSVR